ncbi:MAG: hypothetical protein H7328_00845 [Bdellovibrio sp.]|nr:hypothetical protein [Bdellovibrio sp.]
MSIINSSTTGHNRPQERKFSNKLFIGLILGVVAAVVIFLIVGQRKDMKIQPTENKATESSTGSAPLPVQDQIKTQ